ncbi:MAG: hypothetical protein Kow0049_27060 [Stanieria sp.]
MVAKIMSCYFNYNPFSFVLLAGDNIYEHGEIEKINDTFEIPYQKLLQRNVKFYAAIGNHGIHINKGEDEIRYGAFNMLGKSDWTAYSVSRLGFAIVEVYSDNLEILGIGTNEQIFDRGVISRSLSS